MFSTTAQTAKFISVLNILPGLHEQLTTSVIPECMTMIKKSHKERHQLTAISQISKAVKLVLNHPRVNQAHQNYQVPNHSPTIHISNQLNSTMIRIFY